MADLFRQNIADQRDRIIFGEGYDEKKYGGGSGLRYFDGLTLPQIGRLLDLGILDLSDAQNDAPTVGEIIEFLRGRETDGWYVHGYCVGPDRGDFRVSFEGVGKDSEPSRQDIIDFVTMFRWADDLHIDDDGVRCWYD